MRSTGRRAESPTGWSTADAERLYNIPAWSAGHFAVDDEGRLALRHRHGNIALTEIVSSAREAGLRLPLLLRFDTILRARVRSLIRGFDEAISRHHYEAGYTAVYPIKVNQQAGVVRGILAAGGKRIGLEAGSKPELMAVLGLAPKGAIVICNGYKDRSYIRLALIGQTLGHRVTLVVEKLSEIDLIADEARKLGLTPHIGLRVRLASIGAGKWQNTGGEKSKFGLSARQCLAALDRLTEIGGTGWLHLLHFHLGSQVANLGDIRGGLREAAQFYLRLRSLGVPLDTVDVGGGLGVDYEGTRSRSYCSVNYRLSDYADAVVETLARSCADAGEPMPDLISESGRAMSAHHAVLITDVIDTESGAAPDPGPPPDEEHPVLRELSALCETDHRLPPIERLHEGRTLLDRVLGGFGLGEFDLDQRARAETLMQVLNTRIAGELSPAVRAHRDELDNLREKLADKFFCNFSVFQSLPDVWAIQQIFPIVPLDRLDERPERRALLRDLTCDSDGRIDHYVDRDGIESSLPVHELRPGEPYLIGFFLVGAYQEILGDMHNLFGDTDAAHVAIDDDGRWSLHGVEKGDRADELLAYVHLSHEDLLAAYRDKLDGAALDDETRASYLGELDSGLTAYTYLE